MAPGRAAGGAADAVPAVFDALPVAACAGRRYA
jgi:hypothetical protein